MPFPNTIPAPVHPLTDLKAWITEFPCSLGQLETNDTIQALLGNRESAPLVSSDAIRLAVRDLLRHGGFKPTGRNKPASEYLIKASENQSLVSINAAVDCCNIVSLNSGMPISVVDLDKLELPLSISIAGPGSEYVFNPSGQTLNLEGLLCLNDANGPSANAVKDSQRTKTDESTTRTLTVIWGTNLFAEQVQQATLWYKGLLAEFDVAIIDVVIEAVHPDR